MGSITIGGDDTVQFDGMPLSTLADKDPCVIEFPNELFTMVVGKNGNILVSQNNNGALANIALRLAMGGGDDVTLNSYLAEQVADLAKGGAHTIIVTQNFGGSPNGPVAAIYTLNTVFFTKGVVQRIAAEGDIESVVALYNLRAGSWTRDLT